MSDNFISPANMVPFSSGLAGNPSIEFHSNHRMGSNRLFRPLRMAGYTITLSVQDTITITTVFPTTPLKVAAAGEINFATNRIFTLSFARIEAGRTEGVGGSRLG